MDGQKVLNQILLDWKLSKQTEFVPVQPLRSASVAVDIDSLNNQSNTDKVDEKNTTDAL